VELRIINVLGQTLRVQKVNNVSAGSHSFVVDASGFSNGMYLYQLVFDGNVITRKMLLMK
jgi:hypothetical protein